MLIKGEKVYLRRFEKEDIDCMVNWFKNELDWQAWDAPWEDDDFNEESYRRNKALQLEKRLTSTLDFRLEIMTLQGKHIGWVSYYFIDKNYQYDPQGEDVAIGIVIVDPNDRSHGYGKEALLLFMSLLKDKGYQGIHTQTWSGNLPMIKLAESLGFVEVNRFKNLRFVRGKTYDALTFKVQ